MQVKTYKAETLQDALKLVKEDLGTKAIILGTKKVKVGNAFGLFGKEMIEITASDQHFAKSKMDVLVGDDEPAPNPPRGNLARVPGAYQGGSLAERFSGNDNVEHIINPLKNEIEDLKHSLGEITDSFRREENGLSHIRSVRHDLNEMRNILFSFLEQGTDFRLKNIHKNLAMLFKQLVANGLEERFALKLVEESQRKISRRSIDNYSYVKLYLARVLMQVPKPAKIQGPAGFPLTIALVGPTGVGKTTTLAKIASGQKAENTGLRIGMITLDTFRLGAAEQLKEYAKKIKVKFKTARDSRELNQALRDYSNLDLVLIDTPGASQRDSVKIAEIDQLLGDKPQILKMLLLSACVKDEEMKEVTKRYSELNLHSMVFTKLDEASTFGNLINHAIRFKLPVAYLTTGQQVPEDMEVATKERMVDLVLNVSPDVDAESPFAQSETQPRESIEALV